MHHPISLEKSLSYEGDFFVPCRPSSPEPLFSGEVCDLQIKEYGRFRTSARSVPWGMTVRGGVINVLFDNRGQMQEFYFKDAKNNIITASFRHTAANDCDLIMFADGTNIRLSANDISIIHDNMVLSNETRKEFAKTYDTSSISPRQFIKHGNHR